MKYPLWLEERYSESYWMNQIKEITMKLKEINIFIVDVDMLKSKVNTMVILIR